MSIKKAQLTNHNFSKYSLYCKPPSPSHKREKKALLVNFILSCNVVEGNYIKNSLSLSLYHQYACQGPVFSGKMDNLKLVCASTKILDFVSSKNICHKHQVLPIPVNRICICVRIYVAFFMNKIPLLTLSIDTDVVVISNYLPEVDSPYTGFHLHGYILK